MQNNTVDAKTIVLMVLALVIGIFIGMLVFKDKKDIQENNPIVNPQVSTGVQQPQNPPVNPPAILPATYSYNKFGFTMDLPVGYVPKEITGETGPTISLELPKGWLVYITNATWWEQNNLTGQATLVRTEKIGSTTFSVYKYNGQTPEFYYFRQGNVAYIFNGDVIDHMKSFKFVGWAQ